MKKQIDETKVTIWITNGTRERIKDYRKLIKARDMDTVVGYGLDMLMEIWHKKNNGKKWHA